jgi:hypothetical protein
MKYRIRRRDDENAPWQPADRERVLIVLHPAYFAPVDALRSLDEGFVTTIYTGEYEIRRRQTDELSDIFA